MVKRKKKVIFCHNITDLQFILGFGVVSKVISMNNPSMVVVEGVLRLSLS